MATLEWFHECENGAPIAMTMGTPCMMSQWAREGEEALVEGSWGFKTCDELTGAQVEG